MFDHRDDDCVSIRIYNYIYIYIIICIQKDFYKDASAALVVYDLTRLLDTLPNAIKWKQRVDSFVCRGPGESIPMFLLGNKVCIYTYRRRSHMLTTPFYI